MVSIKQKLGLGWLTPTYLIYGWPFFFKEEATTIGILVFICMVTCRILRLFAYFSYWKFGIVIAIIRRLMAGGICSSDKRLDGKLVIVTGANSGIGRETAKDLVIRGAELVLACRNKQKATQTADEIRLEFGGKLTAIECNLASFESVKTFAKEFGKKYDRLDMIVNNAGVMMAPKTETEDGLELHYATNHFGHFLLTNLLMPYLEKAPDARIINVSALAHWSAKIDLSDMNYDNGYSSLRAYANSKLANILFTREFNRRFAGTNIKSFALHPGVVQSELGRNFPLGFDEIHRNYINMICKTPAEGAQTTVYCAVEAKLEDGCYYSDCSPADSSSASNDPKNARDLWNLSEKICKVEFKCKK